MATILVVDDMPIFRDPISASLRLAGYEPVTACNGREALDLIAARRPDLILLDIAMPVMDGPTFLTLLRQNEKLRDIPVIVLTAISDRIHVIQAARLGIQDYLLKSRFSLKELLERIAKYGVLPKTGTAGKRMAAPAQKAPAPETPARPAPPRSAGTMVVPRLLAREDCVRRAEEAMGTRTLSGVVAQVIGVAASPRGDMSQLADLIAKDPMLSARVLQAANSAAYMSARGAVTSISDAVRHIGCATVRNIATTFGIFDAMPESSADGFNPVRCWQHSFAVAMLCERFAASLDEANPGAAYLAGLCHDLGEILFHTQFAEEYAQVIAMEEHTGKSREELERAMLGMTRGELAIVVLQRMKLPDVIRRPIEAFHGGETGRGDSANRLARVLHLAEVCANGMLLAAGPGATVRPLTASECRAAVGDESPSLPGSESLRSEVFTLTGLLARLSSREQQVMMNPMYRRQRTRVWLARHAALSKCDPLQLALESMSEVVVRDCLPQCTEELAEVSAVVATAASPAAGGFTPADVRKMLDAATGRTLPLLWLVSRSDTTRLADVGVTPTTWPVPLSALAEFVGSSEGEKSHSGSEARMAAAA